MCSAQTDICRQEHHHYRHHSSDRSGSRPASGLLHPPGSSHRADADVHEPTSSDGIARDTAAGSSPLRSPHAGPAAEGVTSSPAPASLPSAVPAVPGDTGADSSSAVAPGGSGHGSSSASPPRAAATGPAVPNDCLPPARDFWPGAVALRMSRSHICFSSFRCAASAAVEAAVRARLAEEEGRMQQRVTELLASLLQQFAAVGLAPRPPTTIASGP